MWTATIGIQANSCLLEPVYRYPYLYSYQCECTLTLGLITPRGCQCLCQLCGDIKLLKVHKNYMKMINMLFALHPSSTQLHSDFCQSVSGMYMVHSSVLEHAGSTWKGTRAVPQDTNDHRHSQAQSNMPGFSSPESPAAPAPYGWTASAPPTAPPLTAQPLLPPTTPAPIEFIAPPVEPTHIHSV